MNVNSACNMTTRVCQCKTGYMYLWETNSCSPGKKYGMQFNLFDIDVKVNENYYVKKMLPVTSLC